MNNEKLLSIHKQLHDSNKTAVILDNKKYPIELSVKDKLKFVVINDIKFIQQNPDKETWHAKQASKGKKITWGIRAGKEWYSLYEDYVLVGET